jgi:hypothetical protein
LDTTSHVLDELLPLLQPRQAEVHVRAALLEVADVAQLIELAANPAIRRFLLARLSDTVALIDAGRAGELAKALLAEGHTPKRTEGNSA